MTTKDHREDTIHMQRNEIDDQTSIVLFSNKNNR